MTLAGFFAEAVQQLSPRTVAVDDKLVVGLTTVASSKDIQWTFLSKPSRDRTLKKTCLMRGHLGRSARTAAVH